MTLVIYQKTIQFHHININLICRTIDANDDARRPRGGVPDSTRVDGDDGGTAVHHQREQRDSRDRHRDRHPARRRRAQRQTRKINLTI